MVNFRNLEKITIWWIAFISNLHTTGPWSEIVFFFLPKPLLASATKTPKLSKHPTLLPGEKILLQQDATCVETYHMPVEGTLHLTTYRVIFSGSAQVC
jgi:hypothetical protein